ncbi:hypothetical protein F2P56_013978 [Juglans regia]|uniref:Uncharacterized protein n=1 Tax=Juglans regia TaxID=51240 RepID=A0A834CRR6_JUGRE|nr:hypothetical protein F2P56_013978 [Juglans regia]
MIISCDQYFQRYGPCLFRFQQLWEEHKEFLPHVKQCWKEEGCGRGLEKLAFKLKRMKQALKTWNMDVFGHVEVMIRDIELRIELLDTRLQAGYEETVEQDLLISKIELDILKSREESMLEQKAKVKWLKEGDNNTRFFHSILKRRHQTQVKQMLKVDGTLYKCPEAVHDGAVQYFQELLSHEGEGELRELSQFIDKEITEEENKEIPKRPTVEEIWQALFSIPVESSPRPDGFSLGFFRASWEFIQGDVVEAVKEFFEGKQLPRFYMALYVALIPKVQQPTGFEKFRPINLCSVL